MTVVLQPYPASYPSGLKWLGDVPAHWVIRRLKHSSTLVMGQSPLSEECSDQPIGLPFLQGCAEFGDYNPVPRQFCVSPPKRATRHAILMSVRAPVGRLNIADQEYGVGRGLCAIIPKESLLTRQFYYYSLVGAMDSLLAACTGSTYDAVSIGDVGNHQILIPPLPEQTAIVRYLDAADSRIQSYISAKERLIELLTEQKQAVINQAVTRGLDPNVPLKPSGLEWLGDMPAHWERRRLKTLLRSVDTRSETGGETLLSLRRDHGVVVYDEHFTRPSQSRSLIGFKLVASDQLVVNRLQANNGLVFCSMLEGLVSQTTPCSRREGPFRCSS